MKIENTDIAMVYSGSEPHPAHRGFAEAVDADLLGLDRISMRIDSLRHSVPEEALNGTVLPSYDVYISEGTRALYGSIAKQIFDDSALIYLAGDQALYKLQTDSYELNTSLNKIISDYGMGALKKLFNTYIDGIIAVSDFSADYTKQILPNKPVRVAHPYIQPNLFDRLDKISTKIEDNVAVTVGAFDRYKGQDLLVDAWQKVRDSHSAAELHLVGSGYPKKVERTPGVHRLGYVEDLPKALSKASLYVQPSRVDNFPVGVLEAMRAGLPAIVTNTTGNKSEITKLDENLVTSATSDALAETICDYFAYSISKRYSLSNAAHEIGSQFDSRSQKEIFRQKFEELVSKI